VIAAIVILAAILGAAYGEWLRRVLRVGSYRLASETGPIPSRWWLAPVAAVAATLLIRHLADLDRWGLVPAYAALVAISLPLGAIDIDVHRLPDNLMLPAIAIIAAMLALEWDADRMVRALTCAALAGAAFLLLALVVPGGMGLGDVKLAVLLGLPLGWWGYLAAVQGFAFGFVIGGMVSVMLICTRRATRQTHIPLGPALLAGALGALLGV